MEIREDHSRQSHTKLGLALHFGLRLFLDLRCVNVNLLFEPGKTLVGRLALRSCAGLVSRRDVTRLTSATQRSSKLVYLLLQCLVAGTSAASLISRFIS